MPSPVCYLKTNYKIDYLNTCTFIREQSIHMPSSSHPKIVNKTVGRRKEAVASVHLMSNSSESTVNNQPISVYFPGLIAKSRYELPLKVLGLNGKYSASIKVHGGGQNGQLDAAVLGLSKGLSLIKEEYKKSLRDAGLLTRDSRTRQRRMVGMGGKSRRQKQSPKR
jgi:small subunit ribosomal protein S9